MPNIASMSVLQCFMKVKHNVYAPHDLALLQITSRSMLEPLPPSLMKNVREVFSQPCLKTDKQTNRQTKQKTDHP